MKIGAGKAIFYITAYMTFLPALSHFQPVATNSMELSINIYQSILRFVKIRAVKRRALLERCQRSPAHTCRTC
jgi:hypothetical protein